MENASKALIMAAEILIGIMIISIGVYLFNIIGKYSAETTAKMEETQIEQFNAQFLKFYGTSSTEGNDPEPIRCTIHDIVGLANLAKKTNESNGFYEEQEPSDNLYYIQIALGNEAHLENFEQNDLIDLVKKNDVKIIENQMTYKAEKKYFKCTVANIGKNTKVINYMKFVEI